MIILLAVAGFLRIVGFFPPRTSDEVKEIRSNIQSRHHALFLVCYFIILMVATWVAIVGMYFDAKIFRWVFLCVILAEFFAIRITFHPMKNTKMDVFRIELQKIVDGMILGVLFVI